MKELILLLVKVKSEVTQSCPTLCDPVDCSPSGSSVHGILQARILEWVAISFSRGSSRPRNWTRISYVSCIGRWVLYRWATREAHGFIYQNLSGKLPYFVWSEKWQPTPVFLPGESHGRRSLMGYSPWGRKESEMTQVTEHSTFNQPTLIKCSLCAEH